MPARCKSSETKDSSANLGYNTELWLAADKLRLAVRHLVLRGIEAEFGNMNAAAFRRDLNPFSIR